jgi:hypothetical protein
MGSVSQYQIRSRWAGGDTPPHFSHYAIASSPPPCIWSPSRSRVSARVHISKKLNFVSNSPARGRHVFAHVRGRHRQLSC